MKAYTAEMNKILTPSKSIVSAYEQQEGVAEYGFEFTRGGDIEFRPIEEFMFSTTGKQILQQHANKLATRYYPFDDNEAYLRISPLYKKLIKTQSDREIMRDYIAFPVGNDTKGTEYRIYHRSKVQPGVDLWTVQEDDNFTTKKEFVRFEKTTGFYIAFVFAFAKRSIGRLGSLHKDFKGLQNDDHFYAHTQEHLEALKSGLFDYYRRKNVGSIWELKSIPTNHFIEVSY